MTTMFESAKEQYAKLGIDVEAAMDKLAQKAISVHCWQGDDVLGFDQEGGLSGGIQTTGNYPGRARNFEELKADFEESMSMVPGTKRIALHASYAIFTDEHPWVDRDQITYDNFEPWVEWAKEHGYGIDFNPTIFGHPKMNNELSLSSPDPETRKFWIDHVKACRKISQQIGEALDDEVLCNIWIPDGLKDVPGDRYGLRARLKDSLDQIFEEKYDRVIDACESKVFGIGLESMTVGSNEFYLAYAATHPGVYNLIDSGHFHPTENVADKLSALLLFFDKIPMHVTRPVRWDSDHVILFDDPTKEIAARDRTLPWCLGKGARRPRFLRRLYQSHRRMGDRLSRYGEIPALRTPTAERSAQRAAGRIPLHGEDDARRSRESRCPSAPYGMNTDAPRGADRS